MQMQELKELKELLEIASVLRGLIGNKQVELLAQREKSISKPKRSKPSRSEEYLKGFSDSAVRVFNAFKKKHQIINRRQNNQEWKLLSEVAPNVEVKTIRANYDKQNKQNSFIGLTEETKTAGINGGILVEVKHLNQKVVIDGKEIKNIETRLIDSIYNRARKQVAFYECPKQE